MAIASIRGRIKDNFHIIAHSYSPINSNSVIVKNIFNYIINRLLIFSGNGVKKYGWQQRCKYLRRLDIIKILRYFYKYSTNLLNPELLWKTLKGQGKSS